MAGRYDDIDRIVQVLVDGMRREGKIFTEVAAEFNRYLFSQEDRELATKQYADMVGKSVDELTAQERNNSLLRAVIERASGEIDSHRAGGPADDGL